MKIIHKYVLREHVGPLVFALSALTSLMLLNYIAKQLGNLVGKGLSWQVILEFFVLSLPFTVAMTLPMAVLVAVLYAFSRLAAENEITAMKANGISMRRILMPVLAWGVFFTMAMIAFNDRLLPATNHRLRALQGDIARKKPSFAIKEQIINEVSPGLFFLRTTHLDQSTNMMREVTIYDLSDQLRRRTIYADSGVMAFADNGSDLKLTLWNGFMQEVPKEEPAKFQRLYFGEDLIRVKGVANAFERDSSDGYKSDREMTVCELQSEVARAERDFFRARERYDRASRVAKANKSTSVDVTVPVTPILPDTGRIGRARVGSLGRTYCDGVGMVDTLALPWIRQRVRQVANLLMPSPALAATMGPQDTLKRDTTKARVDSARRADSLARAAADSAQRAAAATVTPGAPPPPVPGATVVDSTTPAVTPVPVVPDPLAPQVLPPSAGFASTVPVAVEMEAARSEMIRQRSSINQFAVEIHKKFAISFACIVFVLLGAPLALRFPRGGVGLVIGVSLVVFALYYVGLIAGESLADRDKLPPSLSMWAANIIFTVVGLYLLARMEREGGTARGGDSGLWMERLRALWPFRRGRA
ncbi:MAG: LptF/LptG family permease [Gemmatimonadetes bacterium]|nr:LptF/LptG family permease [Gemmatimonadota bacterium]